MNAAIILGFPRGGTSIFGEILAAHPDVVYRPEILRRVTPAKWPKCAVRQGAPEKLLLLKEPYFLAAAHLFRGFLPRAKIVHLIRDGRDAACSMAANVFKGNRGRKWYHDRPGGLLPLDTLDALDPRTAALEVWNLEETFVENELRRGDVQAIDVRFEDLFRFEPGPGALPSRDATVKRVLDFLKLDDDVSEGCYSYLDRVGDVPEPAMLAKFGKGYFVPGHARRVGRWRDEWPEAPFVPMLRRRGYTP